MAEAIVFVPGIQGTKLVDVNKPSHDTIWSGLQKEFESLEKLELTPFSGGVAGYYDEYADVIAREGEIEALAYGEFLRDLETTLPIYIFAYDWRLPATISAALLDKFFQYLKEKSRASSRMTAIDSFHVVTHSLGNFVARAYMKAKDGMGVIDKVAFLAPPFRGSLDMVLAVLTGEGFFAGTRDKIRHLLRTFPGALQLLPSYAEAAAFEPPGPVDFFNVDHWQKNVTEPPKGAKKFRKDLAAAFASALVDAAKAAQSVQDLARLPAAARDRILILARHRYDTLQAVKVLPDEPPGNMVDLRNALRTRHGDGRVPHVSSCCYWDDIVTLIVDNAWLYREYDHAFFLKDERVQHLVGEFFAKARFRHEGIGGTVARVTGLAPVQTMVGNYSYTHTEAQCDPALA